MVLPIFVGLSFEEPYDVHTIGINQKGDQQDHSHDLGSLHEFVSRLAAEDHLVEQKYHMPSIECRYRKYIHKC